MLEFLLRKFDKYYQTCPITHLRDHSVTFIRDEKYLNYLKCALEDVWIIAPKYMETNITRYQEQYCPTVKVHYTDWPEYEFTLFHNKVNEHKSVPEASIGKKCKIHSTVIMDVDGLKVVNAPSGEKLQFKHTGCVTIGNDVEIGPYTVIHRGTMGVTSINNGCKIGAKCNIGHNCQIGTNNIIAAGVIFSGGVYTGNDCWFGSGSIIRHYTSIYDDVVVGTGAVVVKDINKSGIYVGNPARFLKEKNEGWNF